MRIKPRNFLTDLCYRPLNKNDHMNILFVLDCISFITQNLNPFLLERKFICYERNVFQTNSANLLDNTITLLC